MHRRVLQTPLMTQNEIMQAGSHEQMEPLPDAVVKDDGESQQQQQMDADAPLVVHPPPWTDQVTLRCATSLTMPCKYLR